MARGAHFFRPVPNDLTTSFVNRLRAREPAAWFELWENFGPILRSQLSRWGRGRIGAETVKDLSQETLAALSGAIDRHDPSRGARFSTWLLAIARHTLGDEIDRRMAQKRGAGVRPVSLDDAGERALEAVVPEGVFVSRSSEVLPVTGEYERGIATWLNAWVGPLVQRYLARLQSALPHTQLAVMQSSGGTMSAAQAGGQAVHMLLSGPAGGLSGARAIRWSWS